MAAKKKPAKKTAAKKPPAKQIAAKPAAAKKATSKKPVPSKKPPVNKLAAKKLAPKKPEAKKPAAKTAAKSVAKKPVVVKKPAPAAKKPGIVAKAPPKAPTKPAASPVSSAKPTAKQAAKPIGKPTSPAPAPESAAPVAAAAAKPVAAKPAAAKPPVPAPKPVAAAPPPPPPKLPIKGPGGTMLPDDGIKLDAKVLPAHLAILTPEAIAFAVGIERKFGARRHELLAARAARQVRLDAGEKPDFSPMTRSVREGDWTVAPLPKDILDRRVEITGPVDRKMIINALNCGANVFMADFEDASCPSWNNLIDGQINLHDAVKGTIAYSDPASGKSYKLNPKHAVLFVRPRGFALPERHLLVDGKPMAGAFFDFALYFFHNAKTLLKNGSGPYFYLPKLESHLEARLWNDVFVHAQTALGIKTGSIKATVLIETILAAFEMDEILWELREHSAGLNCGRWDYIFSFIKKFASRPSYLMPDRGQVTMVSHFMRAYSQLAIKTCHKRNVHAMGGMAAQIPIKDDAAANDAAMDKVRADKEREAADGHDGTWVAHPGLVPIAKAAFDDKMKDANQIARKRQDVHVVAADLLQVPAGTATEAGLRQNCAVGIGYLEAWLRGQGCVPLYNLMEDAATAEISRAQVWQQLHHEAHLDDGRTVEKPMVRKIVEEELDKIKKSLGAERLAKSRFKEAAKLFLELVEAETFPEFLTLPAYDWLIANEAKLG
jgi:malate synthase